MCFCPFCLFLKSCVFRSNVFHQSVVFQDSFGLLYRSIVRRVVGFSKRVCL